MPPREFENQKALMEYAERNDLAYAWQGARLRQAATAAVAGAIRAPPVVWRTQGDGWLVMRVPSPASALATGTHSDIAATDQIRPIATTTPIPIPMRILHFLYVALSLGEIELPYFQRPSVR